MSRVQVILNHLSPNSKKPTMMESNVCAQQEEKSCLQVRRLEIGDYDKGFIQLLSQLTNAGEVTRQMFQDRFQLLNSAPLRDLHFVMVIEDTREQKIVATASVILEYKFIRSCGKAAHIEDVVVNNNYRGQKLGQLIMQSVVDIAREQGCYKVILDCSDANMPFYAKLGFQRKENQMALYFK
eukprot:TRINITY_DN13122_c0_g1_i5.p1 TRINITY_DN13122_c0_g1~~TRINITY_DN13122_c0_g1_i5.p1  ORF type:complete len:182 (-),score=46.01 TRINITY_DN13122_c0_g1_i5:126-671(-)